MIIRSIAVDDEPLALSVIKAFAGDFPFLTLEKTFTKPNDALKYVEDNPIDLLFLDINMPALSGIDFYKSVRQNAMVIFTTAYSEYAVDGFNLSAIDYLLKPFTPERFAQAVNRARDYFEYTQRKASETATEIYIRADYTLNKIVLKDILLIEGFDDYVKIHMAATRPLVARMTIKSLLEKLPFIDFIRVHRSFIVPVQSIRSIRNKMIQLTDREIPIGASYEAAVMERFAKR